MNITLLNTSTTGGAGLAARRLLDALRRHEYPDARLLVQQAAQPHAGVQALASDWLSDKAAFARFVLERAAFLPDERDASVRWAFSPGRVGADVHRHPLVTSADVLHLHWVNFGFLSLNGLAQLFGLGKPLVWTLHDLWAFTGGCHYSRGCTRFNDHCGHCPLLRRPGPDDLSARIFSRKKEAYLPAALTVVACSNWLAGLARQSALLQNATVRAIPNPIDTDRWCPSDRRAARQTLGLPPDVPLLLFGAASLLDTRKGFAYLAEALHRLKSSWPAATPAPHLVVFGKSDPAALAGLPFEVHNLGQLSGEAALIAAYNAADALAVPSLEDNLPNTIVEALACGTPVVAFGTGGIPEMVRHRQTGWLAPPADAAALAGGLAWVFSENQPELLRQATRQFALDHYAEAVVARQYAAVYEEAGKRKNF